MRLKILRPPISIKYNLSKQKDFFNQTIENLESANFDHLQFLAGSKQAICPGNSKMNIFDFFYFFLRNLL